MQMELGPESPMGKALSAVMRPKLVELGWDSGQQDDTLSEYILLMVANGRSESEVATDLATDLLDLEPDNATTASFAKFLFEQLAILNNPVNQGQADNAAASASTTAPLQPATAPTDATMTDNIADVEHKIPPTGPKAQRNGVQRGRDRRAPGASNFRNHNPAQPNDNALHRIRSTTGTGRINTHTSREPPKGPRSQQIHRGSAMGNGRGMNTMAMGGALNGPTLPPDYMNPAEQMMFYQNLAENARMIAVQMQQMNQAMGSGMMGMRGDHHNRRNGRPHTRRHGNHSQARGKDTEILDDGNPMDEDDPVDANGTNQSHKGPVEQRDLSRITCRFDVTCTKADCSYAHHSPMANEYDNLEPINVETECSYGLACKNKFCKNRHESRAKKLAHQSQQICQWGPFCTKYPNCPFKHENKRACKNGADCSVEGCQFYHMPIKCKHNPCTNHYCPYKHDEGQKQGWGSTAERKFTDLDAEEEVILPEKQEQAEMKVDVEAPQATEATQATQVEAPEAQVIT